MELQLFFSEFFNANFYLSTCCALLNIFNFVGISIVSFCRLVSSLLIVQEFVLLIIVT